MVVRSAHFTLHFVALTAALLTGIACGREAGGSATPASASAPRSATPAPGGTKTGAPGARPSPSIMLAATDVASIATGTIEDGTPLTGDLRPIQTIDIRSRLDGDILSVSAREGQQVAAGQELARFESTEQEGSQKSAEADRAAARADLANAQWTLEQDAALFKAGAIAERDYKNAQQGVASSSARLAATEARLRAASNQARDTRVVAPASGIIDKRLVERGINSLVETGVLIPEKTRANNATLYSLALRSVSP